MDDLKNSESNLIPQNNIVSETNVISPPPRFSRKTKFIVWISGLLLLFILQPLFLTYFHSSSYDCEIFCFPPPEVMQVALVDFIWIIIGLSLIIPKVPPNSRHFSLPFLRMVVIVIASFFVVGYAMNVIDYPYSIYRQYTKPQIIVSSPTSGEVVETGQNFSVDWTTKNISPDDSVYIDFAYQCSGRACIGGTLGFVKNTGHAEIPLSTSTKSGPMSVSLRYPDEHSYGLGSIHENPQEAMTYVQFTLNNPNNAAILQTEKIQEDKANAQTIQHEQELNSNIKSTLLAFREVAQKEYTTQHSYAGLCRTYRGDNIIDTSVPGITYLVNSFIVNLVDAIGSSDLAGRQIEAGIKCISDQENFALSIPLNQILGENSAKIACVDNHFTSVRDGDMKQNVCQ